MNETEGTEGIAEVLAPIPGETPKAHSAFLAYAGLGRSRSLDLAYSEIYGRGQDRGRTGARAPSFFQQWSSRFRWRERIQEYEALLESEYIRLFRDQHYRDLTAYRSDRLKQGVQLGEMSAAMQVYAAMQLRRLIDTNTPMTVDELSRFLRSMAFVSAAGVAARAEALSVKELLAQIEEVRKTDALSDDGLASQEQQ